MVLPENNTLGLTGEAMDLFDARTDRRESTLELSATLDSDDLGALAQGTQALRAAMELREHTLAVRGEARWSATVSRHFLGSYVLALLGVTSLKCDACENFGPGRADLPVGAVFCLMMRPPARTH